MTNNTCVKFSISHQAYKIVSTCAHEISGWNILSRLLHSRAPHLGGINGDVKSDLATLSFRNGEQLEDFHIILSGDIVSPTRLLIEYMKALTKSEKLKEIIAPKMTDLITFIEKNGISADYDGGDIHGIYRYLEIIGAPTTLTTSGHRSHHFGSS